MKERRRVGVLTVFERERPDCRHPRYAVGLSPADLLFDFAKYARAVRWAKEQPQIRHPMKSRPYQPPCKTLLPWLKANLGKRCLAPLTGTDARALSAAVQIAELWTVADDRFTVAKAFSYIVSSMQASTQYLAFHAIAHVGDWSFRGELWEMAGLPQIQPRLCAFEPGGSGIDQSKI